MKNNKKIIAIVDDDLSIRESLEDYFSQLGYIVKTYDNGKHMLNELNEYYINIIICDLKMPNMDGISIIKSLQSKITSPPVIMLTAHGDIPTAVKAIKNGAYDFISKPFDPKKLEQMVEKALNTHQKAVKFPLGSGEVAKKIKARLLKSAFTENNIAIIGEKGINKNLIAKVIHQYNINNKNFIQIDCHIISDAFFKKNFIKNDIFNKAKNGILFLKDLHKLPFEIREKTLKILIKKINSSIDFKIICSIDKPIDKLHNFSYLKKIYFLLKFEEIYIPPLRNHKEDIFELFNLYMAQSAGYHQISIPKLSEEDVMTLSSFNWPGNQEQLKQIAQNFVWLNRNTKTSISHLLKISPVETVGMSNKFDKNLRYLMQDFECQLITQAMIECAGNISQVCDLMKIPRRTLNEKLLKHEINRNTFIVGGNPPNT